MTLTEAGKQLLDETGAEEVALVGDLVARDFDGREHRLNNRPVTVTFRWDIRGQP